MKMLKQSLLFSILIIPFFAISQYSQMRDSLLLELKNQQNDSAKSKTLLFLFNAAIYTNPEEAKGYAIRQLNLSRDIGFLRAEGLANYNLGIFYNNKSSLDSASHFYKKAIALYQKINSETNIALTYGSLAEIESKKGSYDEALSLLDTVSLIYKKNGDYYRLGNTYKQIGAIFMDKGNYKIALEETLKSVRMLDTINKPIRRADAYSQLGKVEYILGNFENALRHKEAALQIYREYKDKVYEAYSLNDIAEILLADGQQKLSLARAKQSLTISDKLDIKDAMASALSNMANVYVEAGDFNKAKLGYEKSLEIFKKIENKLETVKVLIKLGSVNAKIGNTSTAISKLNEAIKNAEEINSKKELRDALKERFLIRKEKGDYPLAINDLERLKAQNDSLFNIAKSQQIEELRTIFDTEKKEQQILLQENEIELLEQKAKINNLQKVLLGVGLGLSLLVFGFGFYGIREKMKRNKIEKEKVDAELAFKKKELTTHALQLAKKNETLEKLKQKAKELKKAERGNTGYQQLIRTINFDLKDDNNWENFSRYFEEVHKDFNSNVKAKYPQVTSNELRLLALLKMNLSSKEIANILNISPEGIKKARYRLRKKLSISTEDSLQDLVLSL